VPTPTHTRELREQSRRLRQDAVFLRERAAELKARQAEFHELFDYWRAHYMWMVCAWCGANMGYKHMERPQKLNVSHGLCPRCLEKCKVIIEKRRV